MSEEPNACGPPNQIAVPDNLECVIIESGNVNNCTLANSTPPPPKKVKSSNRRQQKYRKAWELFPEFKLWLEPCESDVYKAKCKICGRVLVAEISVLHLHAQSKIHVKNCQGYIKALKTIEDQNTSGYSSNPLPRELFEGKKSSSGSSNQKNNTEEISLDSLTLREPSETVGYPQEGNYGDQTITMDMSQISGSRKPPENTYSSKAIVTKPAPPWKATAIVNGHVTRLELNDYKGRYLIFFFYPQNFSAVCPTEILALSDRVLEFRAIQTEIVACSVDSHLSHLAWARTPRNEGGLGNPKIPLLSDPTHSIARDYGVLLPDQGHTLRAHFIIDRRGILRHMMVNDIGVGRSIDELLRTTQALQHVDETETGCPADWKPGMPCV